MTPPSSARSCSACACPARWKSPAGWSPARRSSSKARSRCGMAWRFAASSPVCRGPARDHFQHRRQAPCLRDRHQPAADAARPMAFQQMPVREYPDIDPPIVSVQVTYRGASAEIIENKVTQVIESAVAGIEGIIKMTSSSEDGESRVVIEFDLNRDVDAAANDVRDRVSRVVDNLPEEADPPEIQKADSDTDAVMWLALTSDRM